MNNNMDKQNDQDSTPKDSSDTNSLILSELKSLSSHMTAMESKVNSASYSPQAVLPYTGCPEGLKEVSANMSMSVR